MIEFFIKAGILVGGLGGLLLLMMFIYWMLAIMTNKVAKLEVEEKKLEKEYKDN